MYHLDPNDRRRITSDPVLLESTLEFIRQSALLGKSTEDIQAALSDPNHLSLIEFGLGRFSSDEVKKSAAQTDMEEYCGRHHKKQARLSGKSTFEIINSGRRFERAAKKAARKSSF